MSTLSSSTSNAINLGLRANWAQFSLLVLINAFVGGMVGIERTVLPLLAEAEFGLTSKTAILSFIASFGTVKAIANLFAGRLSDCFGRKRVLIAGWIIGLPVPLIIIFAPSWNWIVLANVLLGVNQGLCWSTTVIMKIDLAGSQQRGLAMGLNEAAGYLAVSAAAFGTGYLATTYALRPHPFVLGIVIAIVGLASSILFTRETRGHAVLEARAHANAQPAVQPSFAHILLLTSWKDRALFAVSQAGMVNNLNDGMAWGLFPLYFALNGLSIGETSILTAIYPAVWGIGQLGAGALSDRVGRKPLIVLGMLVQAGGIFLFILTATFWMWALGSALLGLGTALVYPTLLAAIGDVAYPTWRASAVGVYRLWRDGGYAIGALLAGSVADTLGLRWAIGTVGGITCLAGIIAAAVMYETLPERRQGKPL